MASNTQKIRNPLQVMGPVEVIADATLPLQLTTLQQVQAVRPVSQGGTGVGTLTGILKGNGTSAFTGGATTTDLPEGTNQYFQNSRVDSRVQGTAYAITAGWTFNTTLPTSTLTPTTANQFVTKGYSDAVRTVAMGGTGASTLTGILKGNGTGAITGGATTTDLGEGTNLYFTDSRVDTRVQGQAYAITGQWTFNSALPTSTLTPTANGHLVTKIYVDNLLSGIKWQDPVGTESISGIQASLPSVASFANGDRIIVNTAPAKIYTVVGGAWNAGVTPTANTSVMDKNTESGWVYDATTTLFVQFTGAGQVGAGNGMVKSGNSLDIVGTANRITVNTDSIDLDATAFPSATVANKAFYSTGANAATWGTLPILAGGTGLGTALTAGGIIYSASTTAMATTGAGTAGQVLRSGGAGAPTWGSVAVNMGGTGATSITANSVIIGNSGGTAQAGVTGTTGQVLTATTGGAPSFQTPPVATDSVAGYMSAADHVALTASTLTEVNVTLVDNQVAAATIAGLSFAFATVAAVEVQYVIRRGNGNASTGKIMVVSDALGAVSCIDYGTEVGDCGVTFTAALNGSNIDIKYATTSTGTAAQARFKVLKLNVPT